MSSMPPPQARRPVPRHAGEMDTTIGQMRAAAGLGGLSADVPSGLGALASSQSPADGAVADGGSPMVWQCSACRQILADSNCFVCDIPELKLVCVAKAPGTRPSADVSVSQVGFDKGSAFNLTLCVRCGTPVGRVYRTTSGRMDAARDATCLLSSNITQYNLSQPGGAGGGEGDMGIASVLVRLHTTEDAVGELQGSCSYLSEQVAKLQSMLLVLAEGGQGAPAPAPPATAAIPAAASGLAALSSPPPRLAPAAGRGTKRPRRIVPEPVQ